MWYKARSTYAVASALVLGLACAAPGRACAQTPRDALNLAKSALAQATAARDRARATAREFATPLASATTAVKADAESARQAAESASEFAIDAANDAVALANQRLALASLPIVGGSPSALADTLSAAHTALAAAERADSSVEAARTAYYNAQAQLARDPAVAALAVASAKQAEAHLFQALLHDAQAADQEKRVADLRGNPAALTAQALAANRRAETRRALAALVSARIEAAKLPPLPAAGAHFSVKDVVKNKAPVVLGLTYNPRRRLGEFDVVNGTPDSAFKLTIVPNSLPGAPPRITLNLTFRHEKSGDLSIPRRPRLRLLLDKGEYSLSDSDKKTIAHDFVVVMNETDRTLSAANPIGIKDVTLTIHADDGTVLDTIAGSVRIYPALVNEVRP